METVENLYNKTYAEPDINEISVTRPPSMYRERRHPLAIAGKEGRDLLRDHLPGVGTQVFASNVDCFPDVLFQNHHDRTVAPTGETSNPCWC